MNEEYTRSSQYLLETELHQTFTSKEKYAILLLNGIYHKLLLHSTLLPRIIFPAFIAPVNMQDLSSNLRKATQIFCGIIINLT